MATRDYSTRQEREIAKYMDGKIQSNSGGTKFGGGDVLTRLFLIEAKTPTKEKQSFAIKKEWLDKAKEQSFEQRKLFYMLAFRFEPNGRDYYVIEDWLAKQLIQIMEE